MPIDVRSFAPLRLAMDAVASPPDVMSRYAGKYKLPDPASITMTVQELEEKVSSAGVSHMVLTAPDTANEDLADFIAPIPERFSGIASVNPRGDITGAVRELQHAYNLGFRFLNLASYRDGVRADDHMYYPLYSRAEELSMGVYVHTAFNFGYGLPLNSGRPIHLDRVAADFPDLVLIASHGGWPWVDEMVAVAWHNDNVFIEISAQRPIYMTQEGSGWQPLFNYGNGPLKDRLLWSVSWPYFDLNRHVIETTKLPFAPEVMERMLEDNPRKLLQRVGAL